MESLVAGVPVLGFIGIIAACLAVLGIIIKSAHSIWRFLRKINHFVDDLTGEEARHGRPAEPGLMERVGNMERQLGPIAELEANGGGSIKDRIVAIDDRLRVMETSQIRSRTQWLTYLGTVRGVLSTRDIELPDPPGEAT